MATQLSKLQSMIAEKSGSPLREMDFASNEDLTTIAEENRRLKELAKKKDEELRNIHTVKAHSQRPKTAAAVKAGGDVF